MISKKKSLIISVIFMSMFLTFLVNISFVQAVTAEEAQVSIYKYISMSLSVSICSIAAAFALGKTGMASVASITEKPELFGRTIIYVGMAEGIAIYGLLISFLIWIG
jgi:V/A-type H+-transporting ATPase subunit K